MQIDEWTRESFDEWESPLYDSVIQDSLSTGTPMPSSLTYDHVGPFPEVEIGSASDDEAPPVPPSTQLARENFELRTKVNELMIQSKNMENQNKTLKSQLSKCRNVFKTQIKTNFKKVFK